MSANNGREDQEMRDVDGGREGEPPQRDGTPGSPRRENRDGRVLLYNVHSLNSRLWDNTRDNTDVTTWPESAWAYAARYDFFMESWMLNNRSPGQLASVIWGRRKFI